MMTIISKKMRPLAIALLLVFQTLPLEVSGSPSVFGDRSKG
jgi:hypothetical protein